MEAIAPDSEYSFQNKDRIITGQNEAAIPDQPNIIIQNTVLVGDTNAIIIANANAVRAIKNVTFLVIPDKA